MNIEILWQFAKIAIRVGGINKGDGIDANKLPLAMRDVT
jgi:hypothetical protein